MNRTSRSELWPFARTFGRAAATRLGALVQIGVLLGIALSTQVALAGKPLPPPPPPPVPPPPPNATHLPDISYVLTWLPVGVRASDINNLGDVVGSKSDNAYAFDSSNPSSSIDLNALGAPWYDLNATTPNTLSTGWKTIFHLYGINDNGDIVGTATKRKSKQRVFVLENAFNRDSRPRRFLLLPSRSDANYQAWDINNYGVVVAGENDSDRGVIRYVPDKLGWPYYTTTLAIPDTGLSNVAINDFGVIVDRNNIGSTASSWRLLPGAGPNGTDQIDFFPGVELLAISNNYISGRSSNVIAAGPMRWPELGSIYDDPAIWPNDRRSWGVNDRGDTTFDALVNGYSRGYLYSDAINPDTGEKYGNNGNGILPLDQLVVTDNTDWWTKNTVLSGINNNYVSGFGQVCGTVSDTPYNIDTVRGFVLTPVALP